MKLLPFRRNKLKLTQAQVAARLGEYQSFVARLESGERRIDVVEFLELVEILEFDPVQVIARLKEDAPNLSPLAGRGWAKRG